MKSTSSSGMSREIVMYGFLDRAGILIKYLLKVKVNKNPTDNFFGENRTLTEKD